jgi:hypothetical protein
MMTTKRCQQHGIRTNGYKQQHQLTVHHQRSAAPAFDNRLGWTPVTSCPTLRTGQQGCVNASSDLLSEGFLTGVAGGRLEVSILRLRSTIRMSIAFHNPDAREDALS